MVRPAPYAASGRPEWTHPFPTEAIGLRTADATISRAEMRSTLSGLVAWTASPRHRCDPIRLSRIPTAFGLMTDVFRCPAKSEPSSPPCGANSALGPTPMRRILVKGSTRFRPRESIQTGSREHRTAHSGATSRHSRWYLQHSRYGMGNWCRQPGIRCRTIRAPNDLLRPCGSRPSNRLAPMRDAVVRCAPARAPSPWPLRRGCRPP